MIIKLTEEEELMVLTSLEIAGMKAEEMAKKAENNETAEEWTEKSKKYFELSNRLRV